MCRNQYLHRFELKDQCEEGVKEICLICGKSKFFRLIEGQFNNYEYMQFHQRQGLQPFHPYYNREYKNNPL